MFVAGSWFITAAPYTYQSNDIPPITITAMKENGGEGAYANGPMLRDDYAQIFKDVMPNVQTPPPPASESWRSRPKRPNNSDTEIIEQQHRVQPNDPHRYELSRQAEVYYLESSHHNNPYTTIHQYNI